MFWQLLLGLGTLAAVGIACLLLRALRRHERAATVAAAKLRRHVEPYLRRRGCETGAALPPPTSPSQTLAEVVQLLGSVAETLTAQEKGQAGSEDTLDVAISETVPLSSAMAPAEKS